MGKRTTNVNKEFGQEHMFSFIKRVVFVGIIAGIGNFDSIEIEGC